MNKNFYTIDLNTNFFEFQKITIINIFNHYFLTNYEEITDVELGEIIKYCDHNNINIEYIKTYVDYYTNKGVAVDYNGEYIDESDKIYVDVDGGMLGGVFLDISAINAYSVDFQQFFKTINKEVEFNKLLEDNAVAINGLRV